MKFIYYTFFILLCSTKFIYAQQITVDNNVNLQQLIEDNLVDGCVDISNITSTVNGIPHGLPSYGYFERAGSNFPFANGIMLSTGNAASAGNGLISPPLSEGSTIWGTDPDLETALNTTNTLNATSIEFDIISTSNQFQFNYLFASEDYDGINPCDISDGFVFLIRETSSTGAYQNIALVPGTTSPVNTSTVRPNLLPACAAENEEYFDGYNNGDTNYIGRTTVLTATTTITPLVSYHIKLIIADQTDGTNDSAVFIEGNSFKILDLGDDIETCSSSATLDADIQNPQATYQWFLNGSTINGETNPTINAIQSGTYSVEVTVTLNGNDCIEEDEIIVTLNTEEAITPITNYELCDTTGALGTETFDLSTKSPELAINIPFTNSSFSYHGSENEARNNTGEITAPINNNTNPQTIFVRIEDTDSGCLAFTSFDLIVNELPNITTPTDLEICDEDTSPDGYTVIDLTQKDNEITSGNADLNISYHYNSLDVNTGDNPIPSPYVNINTPTDLVYVRVININTGCVNTTTLNVNITDSPTVDRDTRHTIDACDTDRDGSANFDLTQRINDILNGLDPNTVIITYHENIDEAQTGTSPILNETNYQYDSIDSEPGNTTIYVRIEDNISGCASIVPLEIHTNLLLTGTDTGDFALCDTNDDDNDTLAFNLYTVESYIANNLLTPITVTFYETEGNRDNDTNPIDKDQLYEAASPTTVYIKIEGGGCSELSSITLLVNPILLFEPIEPVPYCDTDDDGIISIDLHSLDDMVTGGNTNFMVTYFPTITDAENNINQLPDFYPNTGPIETITARIESIISGCHTENEFQIRIDTAPAASTPSPFVICDNDDDGFSVINLEDKISEIVMDPSIVNIEFFTSFENASTSTDPITSTTNYNADTQTIYIRVESNATNNNGCYNIVELEVIVNTLPNIPNITPFQICQSGGSSTADFLLSEKDAEILNGQTGKDVFYFEDAALTLPIDKNTIYQNTSSPLQTIYVRVENITDATCQATSSFLIEVAPDPIYNPVTPIITCDDITNDGFETFNLNEKMNEISQGHLNLNITFHENRTAAENGDGDLPLSYENIEQFQQTIYARIESTSSLCFVVEQLNLIILSAPDVTEVSMPLIACSDENSNPFTTFNLEDADFEILDRIQTNIEVHYFEDFDDINENDPLDNSNEIPDPTNFLSDSKTVYIKILNTSSQCYSLIPLELIVNLPPAINTLATIPICDNDTNTYDLSLVDDMIVDDISTVNISYYDNDTDAESNTGAFTSNIYNYTASNHDIFIRVSDINTGCHIVTTFNLQINDNPIANTPPDLINCDDDDDGILEFNLEENDDDILGTQDPAIFNVRYYNDITNAEEGNNRILSTPYAASDGEIIYARVDNTNTGCSNITQFNTYVTPLPIIPINDIVPLCTDNLPLIIDASTGNSNETYLWSTGETTPQIELNSITNIGDYWVTVTTINNTSPNCPNTHNFTVIESESANVNFTTTVDFSDPNSITIELNSGTGDYEFILDGGEPQTSNIFNDVTYGEHIITIIDLNGCEPIDQPVFVVDIPKFFTPNNDVTNDTWHIIGIESPQLVGTKINIYNRHGKLLKTLSHNSSGWDGTYNGQNMPTDDYWYVAKIVQNGEVFDIKGHFTLKR